MKMIRSFGSDTISVKPGKDEALDFIQIESGLNLGNKTVMTMSPDGFCFTEASPDGTALNKYFALSNMPIATSSYWNQIHGSTAEEAMQDKEGLYTMRNLGNNMAFLIKAIALGREQFGLPDAGTPARTDFYKPQCEECSGEPASDEVFVER